MATWGPIQLRLKGSRQVEFDGEASPAPGGGAMPVQAVYNGNEVDVADGDNGNLTWDTLASGTDLLDRSDLANPLFLAAGTYAFTIAVYSTEALTADGYFGVELFPADAPGVIPPSSDPAQAVNGVVVMFTTVVVVADATQALQLNVQNHDGAATRGFQLGQAIIVKLA